MFDFLRELGRKIEAKEVSADALNNKLVVLGQKIVEYYTVDKIINMQQISSQYYSSNYFHVGPRRAMLECMRSIIKIVEQNS